MNMRTTEVAKRIFNFSKNAVSSSYGPLASRLKVLREYARSLDTECQATAIVGSCLSSDPNIISDDIVDLPAVSDDVSSKYQEIDADTFKMIDDGLSDAANILAGTGVSPTVSDFVIVDGDSISYKLSRYSNGSEDHGWDMLSYDDNGNETRIPFVKCEASRCYINNVVKSMNNGMYAKTLPNWLNSIAVVNTINDITNSVVSLCIKGRANATTIYSTLSTHLSSSVSSVKQWANTYVNVFNEAGFSGVVNYIIASLKKIGSGLTDESGIMIFTDNTLLVPKEYIGTMISTVVTTVGGLLVVFGNVVAKLIGVGLSLVGQAISWFSKTLYNDYKTETVSGIVDTDSLGETVVLDEAPYAMCQFELYTSGFLATLKSALQQNAGVAILDVPGGKLHVGMGSSENYLRCEFHPTPFWTFNDIPCDYFSGRVSGESPQTQGSYFAVPRASLSAYDIEQRWLQGTDVGSELRTLNTYSSAGAQALNSESDALVRRVVMRNTGLFLLWLSARMYEATTAPRYAHPISMASSGSPGVGVFISQPGGTPGYISEGTLSLKPIVYAFLPKSGGSIHYRYANTGADGGNVAPHQPTWTEIASFFTSYNNMTSISKAAINSKDAGAAVHANYNISMGVWTPIYGDDFLTSSYYNTSSWQYFDVQSGLSWHSQGGNFMGTTDIVYGQVTPGLFTPKYNRETFWFWIGAMATVTAIAATATVIASVRIKKAIKLKRAANAAKVEAAWSSLTADPTNASKQQTYYKTAKKANLWAKVFGGTSFDVTNYWGDGSSTSAVESGKLYNYILGSDDAEVVQSQAGSTSSSLSDEISGIHTLITG